MKRFEENDWTFLNINSPADLWADYRTDGSVSIKEYDRCRNGHFLVSEFWVDHEQLELEVGVEHADDGAAIGIYFGEGGFDRFWQAVITEKHISLQRPSGVPLGDTFRYEGAKRMEILAEAECKTEFPAVIGVKKAGNECRIFVNGQLYLSHRLSDICKKDHMKSDAEVLEGENQGASAYRWGRLLLGAVNLDSASETKTVFSSWKVGKICRFPKVWGQLKNEAGNPMAGYSVHLCGMKNRWTYTDEEGRFTFDDLPCGSYRGVTGIAGGEYWKFQIVCDGKQLHISDIKKETSAKKEIFEEVTSGSTKVNLNGLWKFDWDKNVKGEKEKWFEKDRHCFSKVIRVPFSFHSLEAFGEGFLAEDENLYQAASWYVNLKETGEDVWYQRVVAAPKSGEWELVFDAVSGYAKVWLDDVCIGCTVDSYERFRLDMGYLESKQEHILTVCVKYPANDIESCRGKQDFWFHASPGIWQTVWMEKVQELRTKDILTEYHFMKDSDRSKEVERQSFEKEPEAVKTDGEIFWDIRGKMKHELSVRQQENKIVCDTLNMQGICRIVFEYEAEQTENITIRTEENILCRAEWDATGRTGYWDKKVCYVHLRGNDTKLILQGWKSLFKVKRGWLEPIRLPKQIQIRTRLYTENLRSKEILCKQCSDVETEMLSVDDRTVLTEDGRLKTDFSFVMQKARRWDPLQPFLYEMALHVYGEDHAESVFQRKIGFREVSSGKYISVNGCDTYIRGVLDQGYNPWGLYTYLSEYEEPLLAEGKECVGKGSMEYDIRKAKDYGYNLIRMHIKDNEAAWYQICDEMGMLVWDEHPLNFYAKWDNERWRGMYYRRLKDMIRKQNYHPGIILYSTFNESWGIMGGHELSAWEIEGAQKWQKRMAEYFHEHGGNVLVVDNSGYAKSEETDVLDYHMYPDEFEDADSFFSRLEKENYAGSSFNCYHRNNKEQMQDDRRRELLQRNCRMDLKHIDYVGNEVQHGQPVFVSEFVHTGRLDQMIRKFAGIAGYIRMNIASQENEDTSPLSAIRLERDFGYRHYNFSKVDYSYMNSQNLVWPDLPVLSKRQSKEQVQIPIYVRIWNSCGPMQLCIYESRTDFQGRENTTTLLKESTFVCKEKEPVKLTEYSYSVPEKCRAIQLFFVVKQNGRIVAENDLRFEVFDQKDQKPDWRVACPVKAESEESHGSLCQKSGRDGYYLYGKGMAEWKIPYKDKGENPDDLRILRMEMSTCECAVGTRITDEKKYSGYVTVELNGKRKVRIFLEDHPWDEKAVFSNSGCSDEQSVPYKKWGTYGYGFQKELPLLKEELAEAKEKGYLRVQVHTEDTGVVIYGRRMGRYGAEPMVVSYEGESRRRLEGQIDQIGI